MTPQQFITKWGPGGPAYDLNERQGAQPHFMDLCALLEAPTPGNMKGLQKRTLTNLYNQSPAWLKMAHHQLDMGPLPPPTVGPTSRQTCPMGKF